MTTRSFLVEKRSYEVTGLGDKDVYLSGITGRYEPKFQRLCSTLPPDAVAMDIGANIGVTSIILGHYLSKGRVFAVEPGKTIFGLLEQNLNRSGLRHVTPLNCAVSDETQTLRFLEKSAYGHLDPNDPARPGEEGAVKAWALDDLVDELKLDRLDFIKVDVEGFEPQFFKGARKVLARFDPVVYFELNSWCLIDHAGNNPVEFMNTIIDDFPAIWRVNKDAGSRAVLEKIVSPSLAQTLVHENMTLSGSVDDIVVASDESKLDPVLVGPTVSHVDALHAPEQFDPVEATSRYLLRQLEAARAERDGLRLQLDLLLNSRSWRYTRFLRGRPQT